MSDSVTRWTAAQQASLSINISWSLLKLMSIESVIPTNHLILCCPFSLLPSNLFQHQGLFQWVSSLHQGAKKYWNFSISSSNEYLGLISFRIDWFHLLAVIGTLMSLFWGFIDGSFHGLLFYIRNSILYLIIHCFIGVTPFCFSQWQKILSL